MILPTYTKAKALPTALGNMKLARSFCQQALDMKIEMFGEHHPRIADAFLIMSETYRKETDYDTGLEYIQQALFSLIEDFAIRDICNNPDFSEVDVSPGLIKAMMMKGQFLYAHYLANGDDKSLEASFETYELAVELTDRVKQEVSVGNAWLKAKTYWPAIYEGAIEAAFQMSKRNDDEAYLEFAFSVAETGKAFSLEQQLAESQARSFAGIPDSLLEAERSFKTDMAYYEKELRTAAQKQDSAKTAFLTNHLFGLKQDYEQLVLDMETNFPAYHQLKHNLSSASLQNIREHFWTMKQH